MLTVRLLTAADAAAYHALRLRSLQEHPEAFGMTPEEEHSAEQYTGILEKSLPNQPYFGAFLDNQLIGIVNLIRYTRKKTQHRMIISGMYVTPEARGQKAGKALLNTLIDYARSQTGVEDVILAVTVGNETARQLYLNGGFQSYSIDPRYIKVADRYYDIEWMILSVRG